MGLSANPIRGFQAREPTTNSDWTINIIVENIGGTNFKMLSIPDGDTERVVIGYFALKIWSHFID